MRRILFLVLLLTIQIASAFAEQNPFSVYTVKIGDTIGSVAERHGVDPANLAAANGLAATEALPSAGTVLLIPKSPGNVLATLYEAKRRGLGAWPKPRYSDEFLTPLTADSAQEEKISAPKTAAPAPGASSYASAARATEAPPAGAARTHTIREGDTLYRISRTYGVSLTSLLQANGLTEKSIIKIGETLSIPGSAEEKADAPVQPAPTKKEPVAEKKPDPLPAPAPSPHLLLTWPLRGGTPPAHTGTSFGEGLSAKATLGEPVHAAADATVLHGGWMRNFGNAIFLNHGDGIATFYGGLGVIYVKSGEKIKRGTRIALVGEAQGSEPRFVFHVLKEGKSVDPRPWIEGAK